jgi:hypothetical protein
MNAKSVSQIALLLTLAAGCAMSVGCSDVGDSSAIPGPDGGADGTLDTGIGPSDDSSSPGDDTSSGDDTSMPSTDTGAGVDTGMESDTGADSEGMDGGADSTTGEDAADSAVADTGSTLDSGVDSTVDMDTGTVHDSAADTTVEVDSSADTGSGMDSAADTGHDAEVDSPADTGTTGTDASDTGSPALAPCTTAGQTNCVQCDGNSTNLCTATEAAFVKHDIDKGHVTAAGPEPSDPNNDFTKEACYECLFHSSCLDDSVFGDHGHECEDLAAGAQPDCASTLSCIIGSDCAATAVSTCYCGTASVASACQGNPAPGPINGSCDTEIAKGLGFPVTDGTDNTKHLTDPTLAAGKADEIFQCALDNGCAACQH